MQVVWSPAALREISEIQRYIAQFNPRAAAKLAEELLVERVNVGALLIGHFAPEVLRKHRDEFDRQSCFSFSIIIWSTPRPRDQELRQMEC